jgi:hypothetical protein
MQLPLITRSAIFSTADDNVAKADMSATSRHAMATRRNNRSIGVPSAFFYWEALSGFGCSEICLRLARYRTATAGPVTLWRQGNSPRLVLTPRALTVIARPSSVRHGSSSAPLTGKIGNYPADGSIRSIADRQTPCTASVERP